MDLKSIINPFRSRTAAEEVTPSEDPSQANVVDKAPASGVDKAPPPKIDPATLPDTPVTASPGAQEALPAQTASEVGARRGNFAAIMSAQKAGAEPKESLASISALTRGEAFGPRKAEALKKVTGHNITRSGLENLYGSVLPDTHAFVSNLSIDRRSGGVDFSVKWLNNEGQQVAKLNRRLARHDDGDVELYSHGCWVEPSHRSRAISAAIMQKEIDLLKNLSPHPRTRLSLWAGGMRDPKNPANFQPLGAYVWATMGFDCAQTHGPRSRLPKGGANKKRCELEAKEHWEVPDFDFAKMMFGAWVDEAAEQGSLPDDPEVLQGLRDAAEQCHNMWALATLNVPGLNVDVDVGGRKSSCHIGKAFLLSEQAPRWEGVFLANGKPDNFHALAQDYCAPRIDKAQTSFQQAQRALAETLDGDDLDAKKAALQTIAKTGDSTWTDTLKGLAEAEPDLKAEALRALRHILGERLTEALGEQAHDPKETVTHRLDAMDLCIQRAPKGREALLKSLVASPETAHDFEVARAALSRLSRGRVDKDMLMGVLERLCDRALNQPEVPDPFPGRRGYTKSHFQQKVETRRAVIGHLLHLEGEPATQLLLQIAKTDPNWEVGAQALEAWMSRTGPKAPQAALTEAKDFLQRARTRHVELKAQEKTGDLMSRISDARCTILEGLGALPADLVVGTLETALQAEPYYDGVHSALKGLARALGQEDPGRVVKHAERWHQTATNSWRMRQDCISLLGTLDEAVALPALARIAKTEGDRQVLRRLLHELPEDGGPVADAAIETVQARLQAFQREDQARRAARE